jgi:TetR/AcrR family transcriptional regulator, transcriptional repressor for nem operon
LWCFSPQSFFMARSKEFNEHEVLEKAVSLFHKNGYYATSAQDIVDTLGISRSSLYDTFGDKRNLFIQSLKQYQKDNSLKMISELKLNNDVEDLIYSIFKIAVQEIQEDTMNKGCFMVNTAIELSAHDEEIKKVVQQNQMDVENAFKVAIKKGQESGVFSKKHNAVAFARFLFNNIVGLRVSSRLSLSSKNQKDIIEVVLQTLKN